MLNCLNWKMKYLKRKHDLHRFRSVYAQKRLYLQRGKRLGRRKTVSCSKRHYGCDYGKIRYGQQQSVRYERNGIEWCANHWTIPMDAMIRIEVMVPYNLAQERWVWLSTRAHGWKKEKRISFCNWNCYVTKSCKALKSLYTDCWGRSLAIRNSHHFDQIADGIVFGDLDFIVVYKCLFVSALLIYSECVMHQCLCILSMFCLLYTFGSFFAAYTQMQCFFVVGYSPSE